MQYADFVSIHKADTPVKLLEALSNEAYWIRCSAVSANESTTEAAISFYNKDLEEHEKRYDYLYRRILLVLPKPNALRPKISGHGASECFVCPTCGKQVEEGDWKCNVCNQPLDWP